MNMIEKVARAIDPHAFEHWEEAYRRKDRWEQVNRIGDITAARERARAAIEAMREPTPLMQTAGDLPGWDDNVSQGLSGDIWTAMIDAALKEE